METYMSLTQMFKCYNVQYIVPSVLMFALIESSDVSRLGAESCLCYCGYILSGIGLHPCGSGRKIADPFAPTCVDKSH